MGACTTITVGTFLSAQNRTGPRYQYDAKNGVAFRDERTGNSEGKTTTQCQD